VRAAALTRRGAGLGVGAVALYAAGEALGYPVLRALACVAAVAVLLSVVLTARPLRLVVARQFDRNRVHRGRTVAVTLIVRNAGRLWTPAFAARDGEPLRIPALRPGREARLEYTMTPQRRGRHPIGPLRVEQSDPLGLTDRRRSTGEASELWVYPRLHPAELTPVGPRRRHLTGTAAQATVRGSQELRALRPYVRGDEPRYIHWKATAVTGDLMVRDLFDPPEPSLTVLLDTAPDALGAELFEEAVDVAASLVVAAVHAGHRTRLRTTAGLDFTPKIGKAGATALLEALCTVQQRPAVALGRVTGAGTFVLVTGAARGDLAWLPGVGADHTVLAALTDAPAAPEPRLAGVTVLAGPDATAVVTRWNASLT
jgi:uncharacterized protein (DUF58 family)